MDSTTSVAIGSQVPLSFNQRFHLEAVDSGSVWLAAAFDVDGPIVPTALAAAYRLLISRHGTLHSSFVRRDDQIDREVHDPDRLILRPAPTIMTSTSEELRLLLRNELDAACHPFDYPAFLLAAIDREDRSTIICGFDHVHVDAYSMSIIVDDLHQLYQGCLATPDGSAADSLPMAGSFVDFCAAESEAAVVTSRDPRMRAWLTFFDEHDNTPPAFPLELGLSKGQVAPQAVDLRGLLDAETTHDFEALCRRNGATVFAGFLAAMAWCIRELGGGPQMSLLFPLHTRRSEEWRGAVGWFTTNAPLNVVATDDFIDSVQRTGPALRNAVSLGEIPVPHVLAAMGGLRPQRNDIFMVSYVDYRPLPGSSAHENISAQHISNATSADDAQFWLSRTDRGLALRTRYPGTPAAQAVIGEFLDKLGQFLANINSPQPAPGSGTSLMG
ncbi:condensation domain-containing protein [Williamsia sp.]|uniref:condensation domain-containing protein n=1 Tax=Williamsia sp. TaxID=1872085 RepID=UPI002F94945C